MVTKIDLSGFVIVVDNGRNVINCENCANYEQFVEIVKELRKNGKIAKNCEVVI